MRVKTGLERLVASPEKWPLKKRLGLLANPASVDSHLRHSRDLISEACPGRLRALYSPQHGFFADKQDNMIESDDMIDPALELPVFSLYGQNRQPTAPMLEPIDTLLIDLQDVGTRVYTFIYTMAYCLEAAQKYDKQVVVLDRPNPVGGVAVEGNLLQPDLTSFVGRYPLPMRHGLTIGELALLFNDYFEIGCDLTVIPLSNWQRPLLFNQTGLPWVAPSPNLPTPASALVYPGQVIWEGTNISEGRGTTQPFEIFGAPFLNVAEIMKWLGKEALPGAVLRPVMFEPTSGKWQGQLCHGFQIHPVKPEQYKPYVASLKLLQAIIALHPEHLAWKEPPYEYEYEKLPLDLIIGDKSIRQRLEKLEKIEEIESSWQKELEQFKKISHNFHLYKG